MAAQPVPVLALDLQARPDAVPHARRAVMAFAAEHGADRALQAVVAAAVTEAVANVVVHAYDHGEPGPLRVEADVEDGDLEVVVLDEGEGFRSGPAPGIGAGLSIVADTADGYAIRERMPSGVELWMRFRLAGE